MTTATLERTDRSKRAGSVWDYISASRLNCWLSCPLKFKLRYVDGIKTPTTPSLFLGKAVHHGLEVVYRHRQLGVTLSAADATQRLEDAWETLVDEDNMDFDSTQQETAMKEQASSLVAAYLAKMPPDEPKPLAVEATMEAPLVDPFNGEDLGIPLLGVTDLVLPGDDGPTIVDFKTSARSSAPLEVSHEIQLGAYAWLFRQLTGDQEGGLEIRSLVKTKTPKIEFHGFGPRTEAHLRRLFAVIRGYLDDLHANRFVYRPGWGCATCDFVDSHCRV
jgi:putative RecB family exonuclease